MTIFHVEGTFITESHDLQDHSKREGDVGSISDWQSIAHYVFIPESAMVNKRYKEAVHMNCPDMWAAKDWMNLHKNTLPH
jgi:hypothetical protein